MGSGILRRSTAGWAAAALATFAVLLVVTAARAADTVAPAVGVATLSPAPDGNANWRRTAPATLNLAATDDVAVEKFQYSLDNGATWVDVPVTPAASVTAAVPLSQEGNTTVRYRAVDTSGNLSPGVSANTTLSAAAAAGATAVRLASTAGRGAGDLLLIDTGAAQESATIASLVTPAPPAPNPNVVLTAPLANAHASGAAVVATPLYRTIALLIDTFAPIAAWPQIVDGAILQSLTLTPTRTDPRRRDATDTANGSGGSAIRRMEVDGEDVIPFPLQLNKLTVGKHTQAVAVQDVAGNVLEYTQTFVVTTSFDDLATVVDQYAGNALRTTLNGATAVGAMGLRLQTPFGFRAGQTIVVDPGGPSQETLTIAKALSPPPTLNTTLSAAAAAGATSIRLASYTTSTSGGPNAPSNNGPIIGQPIVLDNGANQELITVAKHIEPVPPAPEPNVILAAPLAKSHAAGTATSLVNVLLESPATLAHGTGQAVVNPRPLISTATATALKALLTEAKDAAALGNVAGATSALQQFRSLVFDQVKPSAERTAERAALASAAQALVDELKGGGLDTAGTGVTVGPAEPGDGAIREFWNPTPFVANPGATYKILVNGRAGGFRHQSIVDFEAMFQHLGAQHGFDVDIWDPTLTTSPGRQAPPGVSLTVNPFLDLATLMQYRTIVFNSTVGLNAAGLNLVEFSNLQAYIRAGGGFVAIHGATDSMQNVPWYMDLVGAGFTNHGSNAGGILIDTEAGGHVDLLNADPAHPATSAIPARMRTIEELYNTNRNPAELGIVHPLVYEDEATLVGQIGYGTGALLNSDEHAMVWCRNFDGGRSFVSTLGHNWQYAKETWFQQMMLNAVQWTAGATYANCVTFHEVEGLLAAAVAAGNVSPAGNALLSERLAAARTEFEAGNYRRAIGHLQQFVADTRKPSSCGCADGGAALRQLTAKGQELTAWARGLQ